MTVNELRKLLNTMPGNAEVKFLDGVHREEDPVSQALWFTAPEPGGVLILSGEGIRRYNEVVLAKRGDTPLQ